MTGEKMKGFFNSLTPKQQEAALAYVGPENFGFPMTSENTTPAEMPGVEELRAELDRLEAAAPLSVRELAYYLEAERKMLALEAAAIRAEGE